MNRKLAKLWAKLNGYFWLPCPICGEYFAGFEVGQGSIPTNRGVNKMCCKKCDFQAGVISGILEGKRAVWPKTYHVYSDLKKKLEE